MQKRIEWIDIAKAIGIILVSFGHIRNGDGQSVWLPGLEQPINAIYLFHMPLFFFLGGLTFHTNQSFGQFTWRKIRTLLVPYYVFSLYFLAKPIALLLLPSLAKVLRTGHSYSVGHEFYDVFVNGNGLWFLMAYFVGEIIAYWIVKLVDHQFVLTLLGLSMIIGYLLLMYMYPSAYLPFQTLHGVEVAGFLLLGYVCKRYLIPVQLKRRTAIGIFVAMTIGFVLVSWPLLELLGHTLSGFLLELPAMVLGIGAVIVLSVAVGGIIAF